MAADKATVWSRDGGVARKQEVDRRCRKSQESIEANVESADVHVQSATQQLSRAAAYQRSSRKKMCILVIVLLVVGVVVGLIIWASVKH
ncbi:Syntaxin-7 [Liparis tanakae]|uniref:Syntaxin-7 n=1 Tax=Liparis tanakae TaxID=230148 RepID=A0A4Z2G395_9TELE|nr:Syntaxin-7 [Liparis tanakae]